MSKYSEMQEATLPCRASGAPEPEITWKRNGAELATDNRVTILPSGDLRITVSGEQMSCPSHECWGVSHLRQLNCFSVICPGQYTKIIETPCNWPDLWDVTMIFLICSFQNVMINDEGSYECSAANIFGHVQASGQLAVTRKCPLPWPLCESTFGN